jgi:pyruvate-ferredoxin/flavodoxin oxidoreductase
VHAQSQSDRLVVDGNEAAARVAHKLAEVIAIYPITPASPMGELADAWSAAGERNLWGQVPEIVEMQSEAGAAGAVHGALQGGALATTFTASQGLLLMLPEMTKIAGELQPCVFHVAARAVAGHALSIFGDHSDVYAARPTGFAILAGGSVQEAQDMAALAFMTSLESRVPFLHFFDGFRTSHEINVIDPLSDDDLRALVDEEQVAALKQRALSSDHPTLRGSAQNPDVFFQAREAASPFYAAVPRLLEEAMLRFAHRTGRSYRPFEYVGHPEAERVLVAMGSAGATVEAAVQRLTAEGERVGLVTVHLYRPFSSRHLAAVLPFSTRALAVLDRAKDSAAVGEPLYEDVVSALHEEGRLPRTVIGGRYGLGSKEFTPAMARAVFDELARAQAHDLEEVHRDLDVRPHRHFTVGIDDDVSGTSLSHDPAWRIAGRDVGCLFYGLGSDGTVGANKNSAKIIAEEAGRYVQAYFVYDSKKSGAVTVSHLRFGDDPIEAPYLIEEADFVACHQFQLLERVDVLERARPGGTFLLSSPHGADTWRHLPRPVQEQIVAKQLRLHVVDAKRVAREAGLAGRVNTVLQTCFFALSGVLPVEEAIAAIKHAIEKSYGRKGEEMVRRNFAAVDGALAALEEIVPGELNGSGTLDLHADAPPFLQTLLTGHGDELPVSAFDPGGVFPTGTSRYERRALADELPLWDPSICIDCAKCVLVCPHAAIRMKVCEPALLADAPDGFKSKEWRGKDLPGRQLAIAVSPFDCTGCKLCVTACPAVSKTEPRHRSLEMVPAEEERGQAQREWEFFLGLPELERTLVEPGSIKGSQLLEPLFEFSGACSGCGETPYLKLLTQLVGDRLLVANATGCSSIYGGNLPTTPWAQNADGRGPAWANSLFEDNAEFGLGLRLSLDQQRREALGLLEQADVPAELKQALQEPQPDEEAVERARTALTELKALLAGRDDTASIRLTLLADALVEKSVWLVGGDGWAYDIGFGGLDHVLASGRNVKVLVLDTEVYSNTGGQASKSTPRGAVAKFASAGKRTRKKDLGLIAMGYGDVYVAQIALGGDNAQAVRALWEAEHYPGAALVIAYSHCIEHGIEMADGMLHQKDAVDTGYWPLYRYDPRQEKPLRLDSKRKRPVSGFLAEENRFASLQRSRPQTAAELDELEQEDVDGRWSRLELILNGQESPPATPAAG